MENQLENITISDTVFLNFFRCFGNKPCKNHAKLQQKSWSQTLTIPATTTTTDTAEFP